MSNLIVVNNPRDWPLDIPGVAVVAARAYLTDPAYGGDRTARVFNLCKSYRYQTLGYYVSLLAEARGHKPLPRTSTIEDLQSQNMVRLLTEGLDELIQKSLKTIKSDTFQLSIYFGRSAASRHEQLSRQLFNLLHAPLLRAEFERRPAAASGIRDPGHHGIFHRAQAAHGETHSTALQPRHPARPRQPRAALQCESTAEIREGGAGTGHACGIHHQSGLRQADRVRRAAHPRDHLPQPLHLPFLAARHRRRAGGNRRSGLHPEIQQQGLSRSEEHTSELQSQ